MIPVYILKEGVRLPEEGTYYVVARGGIFLRKDGGLVQATVRVKGIPFLEELTPTANLRLPKLPPELVVRTLLFFRRVYQQHTSEAAVLLHYAVAEQAYWLHCPRQQVSSGSVVYSADERINGYQLVGSIHSHASMAAFHSGLDSRDEQHFDGLHITIGRMDQPYFTMSCSSVVNGQRFYLAPDSVVAGIREVDWQAVPSVSYRRKRVPNIQSLDLSVLSWLDFSDVFGVLPARHSDQFYELVLSGGRDYRHVGVPRVWFERVVKAAPAIRQVTCKGG